MQEKGKNKILTKQKKEKGNKQKKKILTKEERYGQTDKDERDLQVKMKVKTKRIEEGTKNKKENNYISRQEINNENKCVSTF